MLRFVKKIIFVRTGHVIHKKELKYCKEAPLVPQQPSQYEVTSFVLECIPYTESQALSYKKVKCFFGGKAS